MAFQSRMLFALILCVLVSSGFSLLVGITSAGGARVLFVGGSGPGNYSRIQDAIDNASIGDTVFVYQGTYHEAIVVDKTIMLLGENRNTTVIDCQNISYTAINISENADGVTVSGFNITSGGFSLMSDNNLISDNVLNVYMGVVIGKRPNNRGVSTGNTIRSNTFLGWYIGVSVIGSSGNNISGNSFTHETAIAVYLKDSHDNNICSNVFVRNYLNVLVYTSDYTRVFGNTVLNSTLQGGGIDVIRCTNTSVYENIVKNNSENGIDIEFSFGTKVYRNQIEYNMGFGIGAGYTRATDIYENNLLNNRWNAHWASTPGDFFILWRNHWHDNYWGKPFTHPKAIFGWIYHGAAGYLPIATPRFQFDLTPATIPYEIPGV